MLDATGFKRKSYADLYDEMETKAKEMFGANVNTSALTPLGIILRIVAWFLSFAWQDAEDVYNSAYINTAAGNQLDRLGPHVGITRNMEQWATGALQIMGTPNYTVPAGFRGATAFDTFFETMEDCELDGAGEGTVAIQSVEPGRIGNVGAGSITVIVNPDANVTSITNPAATEGGREKETDKEFRERFVSSVAGGGAATLPSLYSALLRTPGVRAATVIENFTNSVDADGRPAKSFQAYVLGGTAADIGQTLLDTKAAGIETYGDESVVVQDIGGNSHTVKFSYAVEVEIHVKVTVTKSASYPADGDAQIESAIVQYIGGEDTDRQIYIGLNMGDDVIHFQVAKAVGSIQGVEDAVVELSTDGVTWSDSNIAVDPEEVAQTSHTIIQVVQAP